MRKTGRGSYRVIVETAKTCYPKAETVKPHHYKLSQPNNLPRLDVEPAKTEQIKPLDIWPVLILFLAVCMLVATVIISLFNGG